MIYPHNFEQKIGFDQIRQLLKGKCLSTLGEERVDEMTFSDNYDEINQRLEQVVEFVRITQEEEDFPAQYFFDVRPSLKRIRVEGMYMDEQELFDLRRSLETIRDIVRFLQQSDEPCATVKRCYNKRIWTQYHPPIIYPTKKSTIKRANKIIARENKTIAEVNEYP